MAGYVQTKRFKMKQLRQYDELSKQISQLEAQIVQLKLQKDELEQIQAEIKKELLMMMQSSGLKKAKIDGFSLSLSTYSSTIVEAPDLLSEEFIRVVKQPDLMKIKAAIKAGIGVEGAFITKTTSLTIKHA
jgi:TolA-binding protein